MGDASAPAFAAARDHLKHTYSRLLSNPAVSIAEVNTYSLLLEWKGSQPELAPLLVCGHFDVVPVGNDSIASWSHDPFGGHVVGGCVGVPDGRGIALCRVCLCRPPRSVCMLRRAAATYRT